MEITIDATKLACHTPTTRIPDPEARRRSVLNGLDGVPKGQQMSKYISYYGKSRSTFLGSLSQASVGARSLDAIDLPWCSSLASRH
jgi:hypothetical protein